jgi:hypothetical protein
MFAHRPFGCGGMRLSIVRVVLFPAGKKMIDTDLKLTGK